MKDILCTVVFYNNFLLSRDAGIMFIGNGFSHQKKSLKLNIEISAIFLNWVAEYDVTYFSQYFSGRVNERCL
jgi:hypothetical protein